MSGWLRIVPVLKKRGFLISARKMSLNPGKGVTLKIITSFLESFAPQSLAEEWDNTGLLVEPTSPKNVENVLLTNDLSEDVVSEALGINADLIISYHPPIFKPLSRITVASWKERVIGICLENKIAVYSPHTSWDSVPGGVNDWLAKAFETDIIKPIIQKVEDVNMPNVGSGRYCVLKKEIKISEAIENVKKLTSLKSLNLAIARGASLDTKIKNVAICAGSGSSILDKVKADLLLTGEMSHHSLLDAIHNEKTVILCNHSNSERGFLKEFAKKLESEFISTGLQVFVSKKDKDPIQII